MRIMAEVGSDMEKDIMVANALVDQISNAFGDLSKVLAYKRNAISRIAELEAKKQEATILLASIENSLNVQRLYRYETKDKLSWLPRHDIKSRLKVARDFKTIKECRHDLKDLRNRTEETIAEYERLIARRKAIKVHENLSGYIITLVTTLAGTVNEYRSFRKDFFDLHGLMLPAINLNDLVSRTAENEVQTLNFKLPTFTFVPFVDEDQLLDTYINEDNEEEIEVYEL